MTGNRWPWPVDASAKLRATLDAASPLDEEAADAVREAMREAGAEAGAAEMQAPVQAPVQAHPGWVQVAAFVAASGRREALAAIGVSTEPGDLAEAELGTLHRSGVTVRDGGWVRNDDPGVHAWARELDESVAQLWDQARTAARIAARIAAGEAQAEQARRTG